MMTQTPHARLERFTKTSHVVEEVDEPTAQHLEVLIASMQDEWSAILEVVCGDNTMMISASDDHYAVLMSTSGDFFDLVDQTNTVGEAIFTHGGQPAQHRVRHLVTRDLAIAVMRAFVAECEVPLSDRFVWEKQ